MSIHLFEGLWKFDVAMGKIGLIFLVLVVQVPDKRFYWLKVFALATAKQWEALEKFSKEKKPPIGRMPIKYPFLDHDPSFWIFK